jgi:hypothetical protein
MWLDETEQADRSEIATTLWSLQAFSVSRNVGRLLIHAYKARATGTTNEYCTVIKFGAS